MWDNIVRYCMVAALYETLFWQIEELEYVIDWEVILDQLDVDATSVTIDDLETKYTAILEKQDNLTIQLKKYLTNWEKTFPIVRSSLLCFLFEVQKVDEPLMRDKLLTKYIRLTQDLVGGQNPSLAHAVMSKALLDMYPDFPHVSKVEDNNESSKI